MNRKQMSYAVLALAGCMVALSIAHEGHKAIKAKGVRIDEKGLLHLNPMAQRAIGITVAKVDFGTIEQSIELNARVVLPWHRKAFASARVEGVVLEVRVEPGDRVKQGDTLAIVESFPVQALRLELDQVRIGLALIEANLKRARKLGEAVVPGREILELETERDTRRNTIVTLRMKLQSIGAEADARLPVTAPMGGLVSHVDVVAGQHIEPTHHLFKIHDLSQVWLECEVTEDAVDRVTDGQAVRFVAYAYPDRVFTGIVNNASLVVDERERVRRVWVHLQNRDEALLPGMFGRATMILKQTEDVFVAPKSGIVVDGAERYCFVQTEKGVYRKENVVLGAADGDRVEVLDGVYAGDLVVTNGNHELSALFVSGVLRLSDEAKRNVGLVVEEVAFRRVNDLLRANARVVTPPSRKGVAAARLDGKIERIHVKLGQGVRRGDPVAEVLSLELQNVQLDLIQARRKHDLVAKQLAFIKTLGEQGITARKELLRLENETLAVQTRFSALRSSLLLLGLVDAEIDRVVKTGKPQPGVTIRAPADGRIHEILVVSGQVVAMGDAIVETLDQTRVWIEGAFRETDLAALLGGTSSKRATARTVAHGTRWWAGSISAFERDLSGNEGILRAWMEVGNEDGALLAGMNAMLAVQLGRSEREVIAVPHAAVLSIGGRSYVFVEQGKEFKRVEVEVGRRDTRYTEITDGVFPGDRVVVAGVNELNNALSAVR